MFEIWHDNDFDLAHWFYKNTNLRSKDVVFRQIPKTNSVKDLIAHLSGPGDLAILPAIKYETPDLILIRREVSNGAKIELVVELMTHTPQHDHPLQRFTRIYGSAWLGIPSVLVIPEKKEKLEKGKKDSYKPTMYKANPLVHHLFIKTTQITQTPTLLLMWPEKDGYLKYDKEHPTAPKVEGDMLFLHEFTNKIIDSEDYKIMVAEHINKEKIKSNFQLGEPDYRLTSGKVVKTSQITGMKQTSISRDLGTKLLRNEESFLYFPDGLKSGKSAFRTDPYGGKLCAFDILYCRDSKGRRVRNLALQANKILSSDAGKPTLLSKPHNQEECPFLNLKDVSNARLHFKSYCPFTERKQQRIYGEIPDIVIYEDGEVYFNSNE
jgi:hypothetical protein